MYNNQAEVTELSEARDERHDILKRYRVGFVLNQFLEMEVSTQLEDNDRRSEDAYQLATE